MKYYDFNKINKSVTQNNRFVFGEHNAGRKHFENKFKLDVKGRGKSRKTKIKTASIVMSQGPRDEDAFTVEPEFE